jgi:hypothetical protein
LQPGAIINFRGATKISRDSELDPLCLVPVQIVPVETPLAPLNAAPVKAAPVNPPPRSEDDSETSP